MYSHFIHVCDIFFYDAGLPACSYHQKYGKAIWFWVQEEPLNMGAASFLQMNLKAIKYGVISRQASAATATGYAKVHAKEQNEIITTAFSI